MEDPARMCRRDVVHVMRDLAQKIQEGKSLAGVFSFVLPPDSEGTFDVVAQYTEEDSRGRSTSVVIDKDTWKSPHTNLEGLDVFEGHYLDMTDPDGEGMAGWVEEIGPVETPTAGRYKGKPGRTVTVDYGMGWFVTEECLVKRVSR